MRQTSEQASYLYGTVLTPVKADSLDRNERTCCICFQPFGSTASLQGGTEVPVQLSCGHIFGEACISTWIRSSDSYPLCREKILNVDDRPANRHVPDPGSSHALSFEFASHYDVWLDEEVWNHPSRILEDAVSFADIETLIEHYTGDLLNSRSDSRPERGREVLICGERHGLCHCYGGQGTGTAMLPHRCLTPPAIDEPRPLNINDLDLRQLGSQFA